MSRPDPVLLVSSAVGALGDGATGGVTELVMNTASELCRRGYRVDILAAEASRYAGPARLIGLTGQYQPTIVGAADDSCYPIVPSSLLAHYWQYAQAHQREYGAIINFCHDWLPYYLTPFIQTPVLHQANLADIHKAVTQQIQAVAGRYGHRVGTLSRAQAAALGIEGKTFHCGVGIDMAHYPFNPVPEKGSLIWCARISPEKGLEDAAAMAQRAGKHLVVCGYMQDAAYFERIQAQYGSVMEYKGFLGKQELVQAMGKAEALLATHKWVEAFGVVVIEALACGTPVITYNRGAPAEIVAHGQSGFVIPADDIGQGVAHLARLPELRREQCRRACTEHYSLVSYGDRIEAWLAVTQAH
jgi:UDP-glucose:tetrahydrobiopterin glucosyltransferase